MSKPSAEFSNALGIVQYLHCRLCLEELPRNESPQTFARLSVGFTQQGMQVWCVRHDCNVLHVDYEGHKHPAITSRSKHHEH